MKWIDKNHIEGEMSDIDFMNKVNKIAETRDIKKHGRDGLINIYQEKFEYNGVQYLIKILRYYQLGVPLNEISGMNDLTKYATLEYTSDLKELADFLNSDAIRELTGIHEFLWRDSCHAGQEHWTLKRMVEQMHIEAKECIDQLPKAKKIFQKKSKKLIQQLDKLIPS